MDDESSPNIKMALDLDEQHKIAALKKKCGIKSNTELIRFLIKKCWDELPEGEHQP